MRKILGIALVWLLALQVDVNAFNIQTPLLHCSEDTVRINETLGKLKQSDAVVGKRMVEAAKSFTGAGLDDYYNTDSIAALRLNVDSFTPLMFLNNVIAMTKASENPGYGDWRTFAKEFIDISCRKGTDNGFPSIMYHSSDWIGDNVARGNIRELTEDYNGGMVARTKSLDEMTRNRHDYAALADSATFETVRMTEMGFRTHRIPTLKKETIKKKEILDDLQDGDIIILVPNRDGIDYYDIGIIEMKEDGPHLIHLSPSSKLVQTEEEPLQRYMQLMTKHFQGYRILRVKE